MKDNDDSPTNILMVEEQQDTASVSQSTTKMKTTKFQSQIQQATTLASTVLKKMPFVGGSNS
jgi:hypothetical protein